MKPEDAKKNTGQLWKNQYIISVGTAVLQNSEKWVMIRQNCKVEYEAEESGKQTICSAAAETKAFFDTKATEKFSAKIVF